MSLADFGVQTWPSVRQIARNDDGEVICPVSQIPVDYSHGQIQIPRIHLVDDDLVDALEREDVETITGYGYESPEDVLMPETVSGPDAHGFSSKWIGVRATFDDGERWIPVLKEDLPVVELDAARDDADGRDDATESDVDESDADRAQNTRVGHCQHDETDVYIGRGYDGEDFLDYVDGDLDAGEHGWLGNPYSADEFGREQAVGMFLEQFDLALQRDPELRRELVERCRGKRLGCWCQRLDDDGPTCHGEVIAAYVDRVLVESDGGGQA